MFVTLSAEILLLTCSAMIPREQIAENIHTSALYLCEKEPFFHLTEKDKASRIDRHADAILLNIAYCYDHTAPFASAMRSSYYFDPYRNENDNLLCCVTENVAPTLEYMRYWHGSLAFLRPLFLVFDLSQIYVLNMLVLTLLTAIAFWTVKKEYGIGTGICFFVACIMSAVWYVPFSLEYMSMFVIAFGAVPFAIRLQHKYENSAIPFFLVLGSLTAYADFLTTETLTFTLPLILYLLKQKEKKILFCIKTGISWLFGYGFTWSFKWVLYSIVFQTNGLSDALSSTAERTGGEASASMNLLQQINGAMLRNMRCLFPFSLLDDKTGFVLPVLLLVLSGMLFYVIKKQKHLPDLVPVLFLISLVPFVRFAVLSNHSYIHYFFTFRAQLSGLFCLLLIFYHGTDTDFLIKEYRKIKHKIQTKKRR